MTSNQSGLFLVTWEECISEENEGSTNMEEKGHGYRMVGTLPSVSLELTLLH